MDTLKNCLDYLGLAKLGKKVRIVEYEGKKAIFNKIADDNVEIIIEIEYLTGDKGFVVGRWNEEKKSYGVAYDPDGTKGMVVRYLSAYEPYSEVIKEDKPKKGASKSK